MRERLDKTLNCCVNRRQVRCAEHWSTWSLGTHTVPRENPEELAGHHIQICALLCEGLSLNPGSSFLTTEAGLREEAAL